jgi:hypothetical protein
MLLNIDKKPPAWQIHEVRKESRRKEPRPAEGFPNYGRVATSDLKKTRKGKHHDIMKMIMEDLRGSPSGFAVRIPLSSAEGISILNLRSAIIRAAAKEGLAVSTSSDEDNFYVWKAGTTE